MTTVANLLLGIALLLFGRKLFWLFVGVAGFVLGLSVATSLFAGQPDWIVLLIALIAGVIGAILAVVVQQIAIAIGGFIFGGYALLALLQATSLDIGPWMWLLFIVGGIIGAILVLSLFDPALIGLSALVGAVLIVQAITLSPLLEVGIFIGLLLLGIFVQASILEQRQPAPQTPRRR